MSQHLDIQQGDEQNDENRPYALRLFVAGASINSLRAVNNLKEICEIYLDGNYVLEIIDVYQQKSLAERENIIALPLLIKSFPLPERRMVGDMSDTRKVLKGLGLSI
ncbi:circadian clock KaiB family protein [Dyadobacter psychrotolerans]|uniref:Circadian clock protein KaiB n=1 Tax=Dyadobacter psychrotolerans TaxID=2541721 RepID=A0A4R5DMH4_9BACT|nr:circadian clock KaiB family protein [Dyadobacter psychrotolerans]TDE12095.1 circadian clock protein KaiB [Dyadobacter psychrotolerans]